MAIDKNKLKQIYSTLQNGGYRQDYQTFEKAFTGNDNYANRKKTYDLLTANGAQIGGSYEEFMKKLQVSGSHSSMRTVKSGVAGGHPMSAAEKLQMMGNVAGLVENAKAGVAGTRNRIANQMAIVKKPLNASSRIGENKNVREKRYSYNDNSGKLEKTYVTTLGNEYNSRYNADQEQKQIDQLSHDSSLGGQLENAYRERERLDEALTRRKQEIDKSGNKLTDFLRELAGANSGGPMASRDASRAKYDSDSEYQQLMAAARRNHTTIQLLEDKRDNKMNEFWHNVGTTMLNGYTFSDGLSEMQDAIALQEAEKHLNSINKKRAKGKKLTRDEQNAEAVLKNFATNDAMQGLYGDDYGAWGRAGKMFATSIDYGMDFLLNPGGSAIAKGVSKGFVKGATKGLTKLAGKQAEKLLAKKAMQYTLKATGIGIGAHLGGLAIANTTALPKTVGQLGSAVGGHVVTDKKGSYHVVDKQKLLPALAEVERSQAREYGSEMIGEFLPGGKILKKGLTKVLEKIGLSKVASTFTNIGTKQWYKQYSNLLKAGGYNGIPGEVLEEYEGSLFDALTGHADDAWRDMTSLRNHVDIWLGCGTMGAIMGAVPMMGAAYHTTLYYGYKHKTDKADKVASSLVGDEKWGAIRDKIDQTENGKMTDVLVGILTDKELNDQAKNATLNYARNLTKMRAYNIANVNCAAEDSMNATPQDSHGREAAQRKGTQSVTKSAIERMNASYGMGYNTTDAQAMYDANVTLKAQEKRLSKLLGVDDVRKTMGEDPMAFVEKRKQAGASAEELQAMEDYLASDSVFNGIRDRISDDLYTRLSESDAEVEKRINTEDGMVHKAVLQVRNQDGKEHEVYVLKGNVKMNADGRGVDASSSDNEIYVYDPQEGKTRMMPPSFIERIDEPVDAETVRGTASHSLWLDFASELNKLDRAGLSFQVGDRYDAVDERGVQHRIEVVGGAVDDAGNAMSGYVGVRVDGGEAVAMRTDEIEKMVDNADVQRREAELSGEVSEDGRASETDHAVDADDVPTYAQNEVLTLLDEHGNPVRAEITAAANEDGLYEVQTDEPIDGKRVSMMSAEEIGAAEAPLNPPGRGENEPTKDLQDYEGGATNVAAEPNDEKSALARIPIDEETKEPRYEEVDADTAWDAIVEQTNGDRALAQEVVDDTVNEMSAGIEKAEKAISKATFKGKGIQERIAFAKDKQERMAALDLEKERLAKWKRIASVERMRAAAVEAEKSKAAAAERKARQEEEEKARQAREEAERKEREALNGVPNITEDKPSDARARGYRRVDGHKVDRQAPVKAVKGKEVQVKFDDKNIPAGHVAIVDASELQPSHIGGQRNAKHFIDEAQPKERKDDASVEAARKIASNIRPEEITTSVTAYTGAPTVNSRGEVIQGNNRSAALKEMWTSHPEQGARYKQYLKEHAAEYGLTAEDIDKVQSPVLVNMLDVSDADAIALGQFVASDTESGGTERLKPKNITKKLGDRMKNFSNILLRSSDDESSFSELLDRNGMETLKWLNGIGAITPTQYRSSFDGKGNLTAEAKNDLKGVLYQYVFEGGSTQLEEMFNGLPAKAQRAILSTAYRDYESAQDERMTEEIQDSIMAYHALSQDAQFMSATNHKDARAAVESWKRQYAIDDVTGESYLPSEKFSNFALLLAVMYKGDTQSYIQAKFNAMYDLIQGVREDTLFGTPDNTPRTLAEAINEILNIDYDGQQRSDVLVGGNQVSQAWGTGSPAGAERGERGTQGTEAAERGRRAEESSSRRGVEERQEASGETVFSQAGEPLSEKKNSVSDNTTDTVGTAESGKRNDTATPQNTVSDDKDRGKSSKSKGKEETIAGKVVTDNQGNPLNADGTLKLERVKSVDDLTDDDFSNPTRSVELPSLPSKVDDAIGAKGKPVIIKKNILEKNYKSHPDLTPNQSREILESALYRPDLYGNNQKTKRPYNWVVINTTDEAGHNRLVLLEVNDNKDNVEIVHWHYIRDNALGTLKKQAEREGGLILILPSEQSEEAGGLSSRTPDLSSDGKDSKVSDTKQEKLSENDRANLAELSDFAVDTDSAKRTAVDAAGFDSEALTIPLLVDGKPSRLSVATIVPAVITDRPYQTAVYDYSDDIDDKTNSGWQKWEDLSDEYNSKVSEEERASVFGDSAELHFKTVDAAVKFDDWLRSGRIEKQQSADELRNDTAAKQLATNAVLDALGNAGISVEVVSDEAASEMLGRNEAKAESNNKEDLGTADHVQFMRTSSKKKSASETASPDNQDQPTVVSSADGANILKSLDGEIKKYENISSYPKTFIGDVSKALGAKRQGSASEYASFETKSGKTVTIRLSNHNAKVSTFDAHDEAEGISIVVTPKENKGISNDGNAHVTEFYYNAIKLRRADGKPLVEILKSIKQALYSGAYTDNTGLAEVKEVNVPAASDGQTDSGKVYGWTVGGKIFLTRDGINPNTPIHEYTHLWAEAMRQRNAKGWQSVKNLLKGTPIWNEVLNDPNYRAISADEDAVASEALSRISGRENAKKMEAEAQRMIDEADGIAEKAEAVSFFLKDAGNGLYNLTEVCGTKKREPKRKELFQDRKERYQPASYGD